MEHVIGTATLRPKPPTCQKSWSPDFSATTKERGCVLRKTVEHV